MKQKIPHLTCLILYFLLLLTGIDNWPIMGDEALFFSHSYNVGQALFNPSLTPSQIIRAVTGIGRVGTRSQPPLIYLIQGLSLMFCNIFKLPVELGMRMPSALAYTLTIVILSRYLSKRHKSSATYLPVVILAFAPFLFYMARDGHPYTVSSLFLLVSFLSCTAIIEKLKAHELGYQNRWFQRGFLMAALPLSLACLIGTLSFLSAVAIGLAFVLTVAIVGEGSMIRKLKHSISSVLKLSFLTFLLGAGWWIIFFELSHGESFLGNTIGYTSSEITPDVLMNIFMIRITQTLPIIPGNTLPAFLPEAMTYRLGGYARTFVFSPIISNIVFWGTNLFVLGRKSNREDAFKVFALITVDLHVIFESGWTFNLWSFYMHFPALLFTLLLGDLIVDFIKQEGGIFTDSPASSASTFLSKFVALSKSRKAVSVAFILVSGSFLSLSFGNTFTSVATTIDEENVQIELRQMLLEYEISIIIINEIKDSQYEMTTYYRHPAVAYANWDGLLVMQSFNNNTYKASLAAYQPYVNPPVCPWVLNWSTRPATYPAFYFEALRNGTDFVDYNVAVYSQVPWNLPDYLPSHTDKHLYIFSSK